METIHQYLGSLESEEERQLRLKELQDNGWGIISEKEIQATVADGRKPALLLVLQRKIGD